MNEEWRDIEGYEGIYQISSYGRVRSFKFNKTRILKPGIDTAGYEQVDLYKDRKRDTRRVHRLVAEAFIYNPDNLPFINHKDECKTNNRVSNLEWCTSKYNCNYGTRNERGGKSRKGYKNPKSKKVICITTGEIFDTIREAANRYNICSGNISYCCKGKRKYCGKNKNNEPLIWKYIEEV